MIRWSLILWFGLLPLSLFAQQKDTTHHFPAHAIRYTSVDSAFRLQPIDTGLTGLHYYNPLNPAIQPPSNGVINKRYAHLGNLGSPYKPLSLTTNQDIGLDMGRGYYEAYLRNPNDLPFFRTPTPYTDAFYVLGMQNEHKLHVLHSQNINERFNIGASYDRIHSDGFYQHQTSDHQTISLFSWFQSPNQRYNLLAAGLLNKSTIEENGGIRADSFLNLIPIRKGIDVKLLTAENHLNGKQGFVQQSWDWGYYREHEINDTTTYRTFHPTERLKHQFHYQNRYYTYKDSLNRPQTPDSAFYDHLYLDSLQTRDSFRFAKIENSITFELFKRKDKRDSSFIPRHHTLQASLHHRLYLLSYRNRNTQFKKTQRQDLVTALQWQKTKLPNTRFTYQLKGGYSLLDHTKGDYRFEAGLRYFNPANRDTSIETNLPAYNFKAGLDLSRQQNAPSWMEMIYYGNHQQWDNDFNKTKTNTLRLFTHIPQWDLGLTLKGVLVEDYIYYNAQARPAQYKPAFPVGMAQLTKNFTWRHWHLDNTVLYQQVGQDSVMHVPEVWSKHSLYYDGTFFKGAMDAQIGADLYFRTPYFVPAYMPATNRFYLQRKRWLGHPPLADVFLNFRVKKARVFVKASYIQQSILQEGYFDVLHHPMTDFTVRVGLNWKFFD